MTVVNLGQCRSLLLKWDEVRRLILRGAKDDALNAALVVVSELNSGDDEEDATEMPPSRMYD